MARDISFDMIKEEMEDLLSNFRRQLNSGNYSESKKMVQDVLRLYERTYKVDLDTNPEFDHVFHEIIQRIDTIVTNTNPSPGDTSAHIDLVKTFAKVADGIFKVSEVRRKAMELDPSLESIISANEKGIEDAKKHIQELESIKKEYKKINEEIFGKTSPNLKDKIEDGKFNLGKLDTLNTIIDEIKQKEVMNIKLENDILLDPTLENTLRGNINANKSRIAEITNTASLIIPELESNGLDVSKIRDISDRDVAKTEITNLRNSVDIELTRNYEQVMINLRAACLAHPEVASLQGIDFSKMDPATVDGRKEIENGWEPFLKTSRDIETSINYQKNLIDVYTQSIEQMKEEQKILGIDTTDRQRYEDGIDASVQAKIDAEEDYYYQDEYDKMYGNPEKAEKYKKYLKIFKSSIEERETILRDTDGSELVNDDDSLKIGRYKTVNYEKLRLELQNAGITEDVEGVLKFLQLEEYKERLERTSKIRAGDKYALTEYPSYSEIINASTDAQKSMAMQKLDRQFNEDLEYIATNHLSSNTHEFMAKAIGDAGTLVKFKNGLMPVKGNGLLKAGAHNYASWIGLKNPANAKSLLGKIGYTVMDVALIAASPISVTTKALYRYTPIVGKEAQKRRYIEKFGGEDSSPYDGRADARKMHRREFYKSEMSGIFRGARAWIKATNDDIFKNDRREATEDIVRDEYFEESIRPSIRNRYINGAITSDERRKQKAEENVETRKEAIREVARRSYTYGDMIREPQKTDSEIVEDRVMQGATLELNEEDSAEKLNYTDSFRPRDIRFRNINRALGALHSDLSSELDFSNQEGSVVNTDATGRNIREKAIIASTTRRNYVPYVLTAAAVGLGAKYAISRIQTSSTETVQTEVETIVPGQDEIKKRYAIVDYEEYVRQSEVPNMVERLDVDSLPSTVDELKNAYNGIAGRVNNSVWGGERGSLVTDLSNYDYTTGLHVRIPDATGKIQEFGIRIPKTGHNYENLNPLTGEWGLDTQTISNYIDTTTGTLKGDADIFELIAEIVKKKGNMPDMTGDTLKEMVLTDDRCSAYAHLIQTEGARNGGWIDITTGQNIGTKLVQEGTKLVSTSARRPVWDLVEEIVKGEDTIGTKIVDEVITTTNESLEMAKKLAGNILTGGMIVEAITSPRKADSQEPGPDSPDKVNPGRKKEDDER